MKGQYWMLGDSFMRGFVVIFDRDNNRVGFLGNVIKTSGASIIEGALSFASLFVLLFAL